MNASISNDALLLSNPDRGWRLEAFVDVANLDGSQRDPSYNIWNNINKLKELEERDGYLFSNPKVIQVYFYLDGYFDRPIDKNGLLRIQKVFDVSKELGITIVVRFAYQHVMNDPTGEASDEVMLDHMKQLKPILEKNKNYIHALEAGFLGAWGEWHSFTMQHDRKALMAGIANMIPQDVYMQVRYPKLKDLLKNADGTYIDGITEDFYKKIGIHNDAFFGWTDKFVWGGGPMNPPDIQMTGRPSDDNQWQDAVETGPYAPMGGETFWAYEIQKVLNNSGLETIDGYQAIRQLSIFRNNIFSLMHCYYPELENMYSDKYIYPIMDWRSLPLTEEWLNNNNIIYDELWFRDNDGQKTNRNVFEFIRDYLGYRLTLENSDISGYFTPNSKINIDLDIKNYGYSAAYNIKSGFAVLDKNDNVISRVYAGNPAEWNSRNPENYEDGTVLTHNINADIRVPAENGTYKIAFFAENNVGTKVSFANDIETVDGYAVLNEITVSDNAGQTEIFAFDNGLDMYEKKSINIIGDSISQGMTCQKLYDDSWAAYFKKDIGNKYGVYNIGFTSMLYNTKANVAGAPNCYEIHTIRKADGWQQNIGWKESNMPGNCSYSTSGCGDLEIVVNRNEGNIDRHINGFYINYKQGPSCGNFNIYINGNFVKNINAFARDNNYCARSEFISLPTNISDEIVIRINNSDNNGKEIAIGGISYIENPDAVTVNNYSLSGIRLVELSDDLLKQVSKANVVLLTIGTNDAGTKADLYNFRHKLDVIANTCKENGSILVVGDVMWPRNGSRDWAKAYKKELIACSVKAGGYYLDISSIYDTNSDVLSDGVHPNLKGHKLISELLCDYFDLH